jgi:small subunit ribosomal protein S5
MADEIKPQPNPTASAEAGKPAAPPKAASNSAIPSTLAAYNERKGASAPGQMRRFPGGGRERKPFVKKKEEFDEQVVDLRRVARVMAGGKRFRFRATLIIGDRKGRVGVGMGKGLDVAQAVGKAKHDAKKNVITVRLDKGTIPHEVMAKFSAARVILKPAKEGNGLVAGGAVRAVLSLAGIKDITAKVLGRTPNKVTNALATVEALKSITLSRRVPKHEKKQAVEAKVEKTKPVEIK